MVVVAELKPYHCSSAAPNHLLPAAIAQLQRHHSKIAAAAAQPQNNPLSAFLLQLLVLLVQLAAPLIAGALKQCPHRFQSGLITGSGPRQPGIHLPMLHHVQSVVPVGSFGVGRKKILRQRRHRFRLAAVLPLPCASASAAAARLRFLCTF